MLKQCSINTERVIHCTTRPESGPEMKVKIEVILDSIPTKSNMLITNMKEILLYLIRKKSYLDHLYIFVNFLYILPG